MGIIEKIFKSSNNMNKSNQSINNEHAMKMVQNETITFDENNIIQTINAGEAKAMGKPTNNVVNYEEKVSDNIDKAKLDFKFNNDPNMIDNIKGLKSDIDHASYKWGISPNLIGAIISQESSGGTSSKNIMQIEFKAHHDEIKKVYDFEAGREVSFVLTNDVNNPLYKNVDIKITPIDLENKHTAISIGTAILADCMQDRDFNIPVSLQQYNLGHDGMQNVIIETTKKEGYFVTADIAYDQTNTDFTKHTYITGNGDPNYVKNVVQYLNIYNGGKDSSVVTVKGYNPYTKEMVEQKVDFEPKSMN